MEETPVKQETREVEVMSEDVGGLVKVKVEKQDTMEHAKMPEHPGRDSDSDGDESGEEEGQEQ